MTFDVDHSKLGRGMFISGSKVLDDKEIITYDIRTCAPYKDKIMSNNVMHSVEHILAVELEKGFSELKEFDRIYFGPMGCQTGFYLLVSSPIGCFEPEKVVANVLYYACQRALEKKVVPFNDRLQCGNYRTLGYNEEVDKCLQCIKWLAEMVIKNGICKYTYIPEVNVLASYKVTFGGSTSLVINTNELSLEQVEEIASKNKSPEEFVSAVKDFIKSK